MKPGLAAALGLDVQAVGDDAASKTLTQMAKRGEDPRPAFKTISAELLEAEVKWFRSDGEGTWPALAEATLLAKLDRGQPSTPLIATGMLARSLTKKTGGSGAIRSATRSRMRFGSKVYYGAFHQRGDHVPRRNPLVPVDQRTRRRMIDEVRSFMLGRRKR